MKRDLAEQQVKRIALLRKNALFVATPRGGETAAILSSLTRTCRRHDINPQAYPTQLLANRPDTPVNDIDQWLPDEWKKRSLDHFAEAIPEHALLSIANPVEWPAPSFPVSGAVR